jgi:hypothetical protein
LLDVRARCTLAGVTHPTIDPDDFASRYVALWHEPDADARRAIIRELWTDDGGQLVEPPEEVRTAASAVGFPAPPLAVHGYGELEARVTHAYEQFVAPGEYRFQAAGRPARLEDVLTFHWEMVPVGGGEVAASGYDVFLLTPDNRIQTSYQFITS